MKDQLLIVEDEVDLAGLVAHHVRVEGFSAEVKGDGLEALNSIKKKPPNLVVLDLTLPRLSGFDLLRAIKNDPRTGGVFVLILSAKTDEIDRVLGFELGADDYVVKPFSTRELLFRIRAILQRRLSSEESSYFFQVGELTLDCSRQEVRAANRLVECTATEFRLLRILLERQGIVQHRSRLLADVFGYESSVNSRTVDAHVQRLRDKLGTGARYIQTVRGFGYRISIPGR